MPSNNGRGRRPRVPRIDPNILNTLPPPAPTLPPVTGTYTIIDFGYVDSNDMSIQTNLRDRLLRFSSISPYVSPAPMNGSWHVQRDVRCDDEEPFSFTSDLKSDIIETDMPIIKSKSQELQVTNEFIIQYFESDEWLKRLHSKLESCTYDGFSFNTPPEKRQDALRRAPQEFHINTLLQIVRTSKHFAHKSYDTVFLKQALIDFMAKNDFVAISEPSFLAERVIDQLYNKFYMLDAIVKYESGSLMPVMGKIPTGYVQACPCCKKAQLHSDWMPNYRNCLQLTNTAHTRFFAQLNETDPRQLIPTDNGHQIYVRDNFSRYVCEPCSRNTAQNWFQCNNCGRAEEGAFVCEYSFDNRRPQKHCQKCFEDLMRNHIFINNELAFQPPSLELPSRMRHVGCEFECYVKPVKLPKFERKYVYQIKHDGSLNSVDKGIPIEVVTQPLLDWREDAIKSICKELAGINVSVDNTCGGHIHVDSTGLNMNRQNMMRLRNLFRIYESAFFAVCSKNRLDNSRYCAPVALDNQSGPQDNRYVSLNLCSLQTHNTIEFRCFDGSADAEEWLARIAFAEGFVNLAKDSLNNMIETNDSGVLSGLAKDGGFDTWDGLLDGYNWNRPNVMKEIIAKNGPALINLAACRFKLKPEMISSLVKQHEKSWKL